MDASEIGVLVGGIALIAFILWYFFGEREKVVAQMAEGGVQEIRPGDVVYIEPGEEHWHGATPNRFMAHIAMQEADDSGRVVTWLDHVTAAEYHAAAADQGVPMP